MNAFNWRNSNSSTEFLSEEFFLLTSLIEKDNLEGLPENLLKHDSISDYGKMRRKSFMKYGVHVAVWMSEWSQNIDNYIETAAELGFDGVEISLLGMSDEKINHLRKLIEFNNLEVTCTTGLAISDDIASEDSSTRARGIEYLNWAIDTTSALGSKLLSGVLYSPWGYFQPGKKLERIERSGDSLCKIESKLNSSDVTLGLEAINRFETDLLNTAEEACAFARLINSPKVGVLLDAFHMNMEEKDIKEALIKTGDQLVHFHCVENDRGIPGSGHTPWNEIFSGLADIGYDDWLTMEMFIKSEVEVSPDLNIWRNIENDATDAAKRGLAFLKEKSAGHH